MSPGGDGTWAAFGLVLVAVYLPCVIGFFSDCSHCRLIWVKLFPIVPGIIPAYWMTALLGLNRLPESIEFGLAALDDVGGDRPVDPHRPARQGLADGWPGHRLLLFLLGGVGALRRRSGRESRHCSGHALLTGPYDRRNTSEGRNDDGVLEEVGGASWDCWGRGHRAACSWPWGARPGRKHPQACGPEEEPAGEVDVTQGPRRTATSRRPSTLAIQAAAEVGPGGGSAGQLLREGCLRPFRRDRGVQRPDGDHRGHPC